MSKLYEQILSSKIFFIVGPCVLDTEDNAFLIAEKIFKLKEKYKYPFIFKASFDKANRQSIDSYRGLGIEKTKEIMLKIREKYNLALLTDVHETYQVEKIDFVDIIQIPAFLCRQTDLLIAAGKTDCIVNIKKGQFMSSEQMKSIIDKVYSTGNKKVFLTERGTFFGYGDLIVDFRNISKMTNLGVPVVFDATHSVQKPLVGVSGGLREYIKPYALSSLNFGAKGIFMEVHPDPDSALCDGANSLDFYMLEDIVDSLVRSLK